MFGGLLLLGFTGLLSLLGSLAGFVCSLFQLLGGLLKILRGLVHFLLRFTRLAGLGGLLGFTGFLCRLF